MDDLERRRQEPDTSGGLADIMRRKVSKDKKVPYESKINQRLLSLATSFSRKGDRAYKTEGDGVGQEEADTEAINKIMDDFSDIAQSIKAEAGPASLPANAEAAPQEAPESQEEIEFRRMMEKVKDDFSINAGSILDALGIGHLAKKAMMDEVRPRSAEVLSRDRARRTRLTRTDPVRHEKPTAKKVEEEEEVSPKEFIASIESIISRTEKECSEISTATEEVRMARPAVPTAADGAGNAMSENTATADKPLLETAVPEPEMPAETPLSASPQGVSKPEMPFVTQPELPIPAKAPVMPSGVRISAMKFKSVDHSKSKKTPTPPKISIRPHIKPLNKSPIDGVKTVQARQHPMSSAPLAPRSLEPKTEALPGEIICHSCNAKMPEDSQRCAICGSDLKAPKVRCRKCGEINPRGVGKCNRCSSGMDE
jgi:ribosomal protein L40E